MGLVNREPVPGIDIRRIKRPRQVCRSEPRLTAMLLVAVLVTAALCTKVSSPYEHAVSLPVPTRGLA